MAVDVTAQRGDGFAIGEHLSAEMVYMLAHTVCCRFKETETGQALIHANYAFIALFTLEMLLKICAMGFVVGKNTYLRDGGWDRPWGWQLWPQTCSEWWEELQRWGDSSLSSAREVRREDDKAQVASGTSLPAEHAAWGGVGVGDRGPQRGEDRAAEGAWLAAHTAHQPDQPAHPARITCAMYPKRAGQGARVSLAAWASSKRTPHAPSQGGMCWTSLLCAPATWSSLPWGTTQPSGDQPGGTRRLGRSTAGGQVRQRAWHSGATGLRWQA